MISGVWREGSILIPVRNIVRILAKIVFFLVKEFNKHKVKDRNNLQKEQDLKRRKITSCIISILFVQSITLKQQKTNETVKDYNKPKIC